MTPRSLWPAIALLFAFAALSLSSASRDSGAAPIDPLVRADVARQPEKDRPFLRYFSFAAVKADSDHLALYRNALTKLVNSLSWQKTLAAPAALGADGVAAKIFRIDLRALGWDDDAWKLIAGDSLVAAGDTFIVNASQPPLYWNILGLPDTESALESKLDVNASADFEDDAIARAGFSHSAVAAFPRIIERHVTEYGAFWRAFDFSDAEGHHDVFSYPFGPGKGVNSFHPSQVALLFNLPNGLQAYLLVDGDGKRIDRTQVGILKDPNRPDHRAVAGISCIACHASGVLPHDDELRDYSQDNPDVFTEAEVRLLRRQYPQTSRFRALIRQDRARFAQALARLHISTMGREPIQEAALSFEAKP